MNKIIKKISGAVQLVLMAPIKLPGKAMQVLKYVAIGLGTLETMTREENKGNPVPDSFGDDKVTSEQGEEGE